MSEQNPGGDGLLIAGVAVLTGLAVVVWAGAQTAALLFGTHRFLGADPGDAITALPQLVLTPGDPAQAWPDRQSTRLPGPLGYWAATLLVLLLTVLAAALLLERFTRAPVGLQQRRRMGLDPEGRFARGLDLLPLWVSRARPGRIVLGWVGAQHPDLPVAGWDRITRRGHLVATESPHTRMDTIIPPRLQGRLLSRMGQRGSVIVFGPSQCGKTAALAIPAILEWAGPVIALSVKSDLMGATIDRRRDLGEVRVFDPAAITREPSDAWSPLQAATTLAGARRAARSIANSTSWTKESGEMGFWTDAGEDLLAGLFWLAATTGLGIDTVVQWVLTMEQDTVRTLLGPLALHTSPTVAATARQVLEAFDGVWRSDPRQVSSVYLTARAMIRPWQEPTVLASAERPHPDLASIDLDWLLGPPTDRDGTGANTLYLCADLDDAERLAPVLGGLVDDLMKQAYAQVGADNTPLDPGLLVVIDEAGNWPMRNLPGRISTCAGLGIQLMLIYQSKAQLDAVYDRRADVIISNAITKVFFAGLSDESTLRYTGLLLGDEHVVSRSTSTDLPALGPGSGRRNLSQQPTKVDLMPASLLRQVRPGEALLIHNTLRPAHLHGRYWFLEPDLFELATGQACTREELADRNRRHRTPATGGLSDSSWLPAAVTRRRRLRGE